MDLLPISTAGKFAVLAVLGETEECQPLDLIGKLRASGSSDAVHAHQYLTVILPARGLGRGLPSSWLDRLGGADEGLIRLQPFEDGQLYLYFFVAGPLMIVFAGADLIDKAGRSLDVGLEHARRTRAAYFAARDADEIVILPLDQQPPRGKCDVN